MRRLTRLCYREYIIYERLNDEEAITRRETRQQLVCHVDGVPLVKTLALNGRPTGERESDGWPSIRDDENWNRQRHQAAERRSRFDEIIAEVPNAFDFTPAGEEIVDGRRTTLFRLTPKPGYRPRSRTTELLRHVTGRAWVDMAAVETVRLHAVVTSDFDMWGGVAFKVYKGGTYELRQRPLDSGWAPYFAEERWHARVAIFKHLAQHLRVERAEFRAVPASLRADKLAGK